MMAIGKAGAACGMSDETLKYYEELGLFFGCFDEASRLRRLDAISSLVKAGVAPEKIAQHPVLLDDRAETRPERIRIMKKERFRLLDDIHERQQSLDCLDCIIRDIKRAAR